MNVFQRLNQSVDVAQSTNKRDNQNTQASKNRETNFNACGDNQRQKTVFQSSQELSQALKAANKNSNSKKPGAVARTQKAGSLALKHTVSSRQRAIDTQQLKNGKFDVTTPKSNSTYDVQSTPKSGFGGNKTSKSKEKMGIQKSENSFHLNLQFLNKTPKEIETRARSQMKLQYQTKQVQNKAFIYGQENGRDDAMRIEDELQMSREMSAESLSKKSTKMRNCKTQNQVDKFQSMESLNEQDVLQKEKMKDLGNSYMKRSSVNTKKKTCTHVHPAPLSMKREEQMILESMKQAQTEYMQQKQQDADSKCNETADMVKSKPSRNRKLNLSIDTQNLNESIKSQIKQAPPKPQIIDKAEMQQKLKYLYQRLGAVMRGYKARRIYHNNRQIRKIRIEFRDLIQFAYSLKIEIQNLQNMHTPNQVQIENTKQMLLTSLRDLIQKRQQFAQQMQRLHNSQNSSYDHRQYSPQRGPSQVVWIAESKPRFIQSCQYQKEGQQTTISVQKSQESKSTYRAKKSKRDSRSRSQYRQQFISASQFNASTGRREESSLESRVQLNRSIYQEEATKHSRKATTKPVLEKSPSTSKPTIQYQKMLNSDLLYDAHNRSVDQVDSPSKNRMQYKPISSSVSPIQSRSLIKAREIVENFKNERLYSKKQQSDIIQSSYHIKRPQSSLTELKEQDDVADRHNFLKKTKNAGNEYDAAQSIQREREARSRQRYQEKQNENVDGVSIKVGLQANRMSTNTPAVVPQSPERSRDPENRASITPKKTPISQFKKQYESPYKYQPQQASESQTGNKDFLKANIEKIKSIEEKRKASATPNEQLQNHCHSRPRADSAVEQPRLKSSKSVDIVQPVTEERPRRTFESKIPRLTPSKSPMRAERVEKSGSKPPAKQHKRVASKVAEYIHQSRRSSQEQNMTASNGKLLETNDWIRQSNQDYIKKVLNTKGESNLNISSHNPLRRSSTSQSGYSSPKAKQDLDQQRRISVSYALNQYRNEIKSQIVNKRYEHKKNHSEISGLCQSQSETTSCINIEAKPELFQAQSPSPSPERQTQPSPIRLNSIRQRVSPAKSQISEEASPSKLLQKIIERFSPLKNATFENQYIQKRGPSRGKPASVLRHQQGIQIAQKDDQSSALNIVKCEEPSPQDKPAKSPDLANAMSEVSVSQIAESPSKSQVNPERSARRGQSQVVSPEKPMSYTKTGEANQALTTLDEERIRNDIDMFDPNRRCLDLRRSSNFNSFAASELRDSGTFKAGFFNKQESRANPYLMGQGICQDVKSEKASIACQQTGNVRGEKESESTFRLCPQTVDYSSNAHSRMNSNSTSIQNIAEDNDYSESSPTKTRSMVLRDFVTQPEQESAQYDLNQMHSPPKTPQSPQKSPKKSMRSPNKNKENCQDDKDFQIELVQAPKIIKGQVDDTQRARRRSRGERQTKSSQRLSTGRVTANAYKRAPHQVKNTAIQEAYQTPVLQERNGNFSEDKQKTPTSQMAIEYNNFSQNKYSPVKVAEPMIMSSQTTPNKPQQPTVDYLQTPEKQDQNLATPSSKQLTIPVASSTKKAKGSGYKRLSNQKRSKQTFNAPKPGASHQARPMSQKLITSPKQSMMVDQNYNGQINLRESQSDLTSTLQTIQSAVAQLQMQQSDLDQCPEQDKIQAVIQNLQQQVQQMNMLMANR